MPGLSSSVPSSPTSKKTFNRPSPPKSLPNTPTKPKASVQHIPFLRSSPFKNTPVYIPRTTPVSTPTPTHSQSPRKIESTERNRSPEAPAAPKKKERKSNHRAYLGKRSATYLGNKQESVFGQTRNPKGVKFLWNFRHVSGENPDSGYA